MRKTRSAGGVVTNEEGKVLVVSQRGTSWSLPKGHIDPGENALAAARREIYEESGIRDLELVRELGSYERHKIGVNGGDDRSELKVITMFLFRTSEKSLSIGPRSDSCSRTRRTRSSLEEYSSNLQACISISVGRRFASTEILTHSGRPAVCWA